MTIDISKIKPGDKVTLVPLKVRRSNPLTISVILPNGDSYAITSDQIAAHHPAPFQVGNRVRLTDGGSNLATVKGLDDCGEAWVLWDNDAGWSSLPAERFTLVEAGQ